MAFTLWFTGIPASGKTTLARQVFEILQQQGEAVELLDSDVVVRYLQGFFEATPRGRDLNARMMAIVAMFLNRHQISCLAVATSPGAQARTAHRDLIDHYIEAYCQCPVSIAQQRDPKGLYRLAAQGSIPNFTGSDAPYEEPSAPELVLHTGEQTIPECVEKIVTYLTEHHYLQKKVDACSKNPEK